MSNPSNLFKSGDQLSKRSVLIWRIAQIGVWLVGASIFFCLVFFPPLGVVLFWNILIPVAPALLVVAVGLWRNVCPLATTALLPRNFNLSLRKKMSITLQGKLSLVAVVALFLIVPLRHPVLNASGHATAILLSVAAIVAVSMGFIFEWKSGWCSSLCPVHPVERLYGSNVMFALPNAHCGQCMSCVVPCPDTTPNMQPNASQKTIYHRISGFLIIGGLPGFIWGWFHSADNYSSVTAVVVADSYRLPFVGMITSLLIFWLLTRFFREKHDKTVTDVFAASAVSCYYWYRIPALFGFGHFPEDGLLINLSNVLPDWSVAGLMVGITVFFFWWIVVRKPNQSSWVIRPNYAPGILHQKNG